MITDLVKLLVSGAERILSEQGKLIPASFIIKDEKVVQMVQMALKNSASKKDIIFKIGGLCKFAGGDKLIILMEAFYMTMDKRDLKRVMENYEMEGLHTYPDKMKKEAIVAVIIDFKENRSTSMIEAFERKGEGFKFGELSPSAEGNGAMADAAIRGYKSADHYKNVSLNN